MIKVGSVAPNFNLMDHNRRLVSLESFLGTKNVILSFFVFAFTDNWTSQISEFREYKSKFTKRNTQVLGISCDSRPAQTAFAGSLGSIPYTVLADFYPHGGVAQSYGVFDEDRGTPIRSVVVIDKKGIVQFIQNYTAASDLDPKDILAIVDNLD